MVKVIATDQAVLLVSSIQSQEIGWEERLRNDLFRVQWDVKPQLNHSISQSLNEPLDPFPFWAAAEQKGGQG